MSKQYPCILTLDPSIGIITNASDLVAYIIRQFFGTPGRFSDTYKSSELISFREIKSTYNNQLSLICQNVEIALTSVLRNLIPSEEITVECTLSNKYSDIRYDLQISVLVASVVNGVAVKEPLLTTADVAVENDEFVIKLKGDK